jgi:hypothetical protein
MSLGGLLAHEFVHSWNGKFRRPADLTVPYYEQPMKTDLLWGYEGLTDYLGPMLAARSGLWTPDQYHEYLASIAAMLGPGRPGIGWQLCGWSSLTSIGHYPRPASRFSPSCLWHFTCVPRASGRVGRTRGWRRSDGWRNTRHVLGCSRHGGDRGRRVVVRNSRVIEAYQSRHSECASPFAIRAHRIAAQSKKPLLPTS